LRGRGYYDEVSEEFRRGHVLMIGDWPGFYSRYKDPQTCAVIEQFDVAVYPAGPAGVRKSYAGCHSFAIPKAAPDVQGALLLLRYLISPEVQYLEASQSGHTPVRRTVFDRVKGELPEGSRDARRMAVLERTIEHYAMIPPTFARYPMVQDNAYPRALVGFPDARLKVAQLRIPNLTIPVSRHHIELVEYEHPRGAAIQLATNSPGVGHWAFVVDDIHAQVARLRGLGVRF